MIRAGFIVVLLVSQFTCFAQEVEEVRLEKDEQDRMEFSGVFKSAVGLDLGGSAGYAGVYWNHLVAPWWRIGLGAGYASAGAETTFFPFGIGRDKLLLNAGLRATYGIGANTGGNVHFAVPIGISWFASYRLNVELNAGPVFVLNQQQLVLSPFNEFQPAWISLKVGYRYSVYAFRRKKRLATADQSE